MKEILFRGKRIDSGEWVEGWYFPLKHEDDTDHAYIIPVGQNVYTPIGKLFVEVNPDTIGQFTGLRDKDGNRIFKGDIVDCNGHEQVVIWDYQYLNALDGRICRSDWTVRVAGTIHDKEKA